MTLLWPSMTDYSGAIQNAERSLQLPALANAEFATLPPMGLPAFASGQNAVVFSAKIGSKSTAIRCFTSPSEDGRRRYQALERHLRTHPVVAMASASWIDDAIDVNGRLWPIVTMDWIDGDQLHEWVQAHVRDSNAISALADGWTSTCQSLRSADVTHGDLQHGNVLVDGSGKLRLIDFDGVWVSEIDDSPPNEVGHPNYQHPARSETGAWGWSIDWFSALGVLVSLRALAADSSLWELHNGENLIFRESDYWGDAEIWRTLERSPDTEVVSMARLLAEGCAHDCDAPYDLPTILREGFTEAPAPAPSGTASDTSRQGTESKPPTNGSREPSEAANPVGAWWAHEGSTAREVDTPPPLPPRAEEPTETSPSSATDDVNFVWVTGPGTDQVPGAAGPRSDGVRPPERDRPIEHDVTASWDGAKEPPPPNRSKRPPAPVGRTPAGPTSHAPSPSQPGHTPSAILAYVVLIILFVIIGVLIGLATASG